jgi:hypothetical protein
MGVTTPPPDETEKRRTSAAADDPAPSGDDPARPADDAAPPATDPPPPAERRRRRWWVAGIVTAAVVVVLALCTGAGFLVAGIDRATDRDDDRERRTAQTADACLALERRLNRVAPPGAALDLRRRAAAVRDENAAVRPFIEQVDSYVRGRQSYARWVEGWRQLVAARITYADALDRQAAGGEPAFFIPPRTDRGEPALDNLEWGHTYCAGPARRLAAPDL